MEPQDPVSVLYLSYFEPTSDPTDAHYMALYPMLSPSFYQLCFYIFCHLCRLNNQHHAALLLHLFCLLVYHIFPIFAPFWGSILLDSPNHYTDQYICVQVLPNQLWVLGACQLLRVYQLNHHLLVFLLFRSHIYPNLVAASQLHDTSHMMVYCDIFFQSLPHYHMDNLCSGASARAARRARAEPHS